MTKHLPLAGSQPSLVHGVHHWYARCLEGAFFEVAIVLHRGAEASHLDDVVHWAQEVGLTVRCSSHHRRSVVVCGMRDKVEAAFKVTIHHFHSGGPGFRSHHEPVSLPDHLHGKVLAVLGLDTRPVAKPYVRRGYHFDTDDVVRQLATGAALHVPPGSFTPPQVAELYGFPKPERTGAKQTVALIELGGGFRQADIAAYFKAMNLPTPVVEAVSVNGATNRPSGPDGADGEVMLDIDVLGSIVPHARIPVYFAENTDRGFHDAIMQAAHDKARDVGVISISWGGPESGWSESAINAMQAAFEDCAANGVTVLAAAGDNGSSDGINDHHDHVDFPASSPLVMACGGTKLVASGGKITSETVWNDGPGQGAGGGGHSAVFSRPGWQPVNANGMRAVPDVSGNADPASGYVTRVDGQYVTVGGTSACAPLYAALVAIRNQIKGHKSGLLNPLLYQHPEVCRDITVGNNGDQKAGPGYDTATGLGVPIGQRFCEL